MAQKFKVGDRVRVVANIKPPNWRYMPPDYTGREGVIVMQDDDPDGYVWTLDFVWDGGFHSDELAPLADPAADAFLARIKRLAKEPQPLKADELHTVRGGVA